MCSSIPIYYLQAFELANDEDPRVQRAALKSLKEMVPLMGSSMISQLMFPFMLGMLQRAAENPDQAAKSGLDTASASLGLSVCSVRPSCVDWNWNFNAVPS